MALTLYYAPGACSLAPHVALEETGAPFELLRLNLAEGDQRRAGYLAINPKGRVPTLVTEAGPITEVIAILTYLDRRFPEADLLPREDPQSAARAYEIMSWLASTVHVAFAQITRPERYVDEPAAAAGLAAPGRARFLKALSVLEGLAAHPGDWILGERFSAVDAYVLVIRRWAERVNADFEALPAFKAKTDRTLERASVQRALAREAAQPAAATPI
jgi:glutathione S-transferase